MTPPVFGPGSGISVDSNPGSRQVQHKQPPPACDGRRPLSNDLAEHAEIVITVHGEEFTVKQFRQEVTISRPGGPGFTSSIKLFVGGDISQCGSHSVGKQQIGPTICISIDPAVP